MKLQWVQKYLLLTLASLIGGFSALPASSAGLAEYEALDDTALLEILPTVEPREQGLIYIMLGRANLDRDVTQAHAYLAQASRLVDPNDLVAQSYLDSTWCWSYVAVSGIEKAPATCQSGADKALASGDPWVLTKAYGAQSVMHYQTGNLEEAIRLGRLATQFAEQTKNSTTIANQYNSMGLILRAQGLYEVGLDHFARGLQVLNLDNSNDAELYHIMNFNVGLSHADLGNYSLAKDYYQAGLAWAQESGRHAKELTALVYIAIADIALGEPQLAVTQLSRTLVRPEISQNKGYFAFAYAVIGEGQLALGRPELALQAYHQGMAIAAEEPNTYEQRRLKAGYANALYTLGNLPEARTVLQQAIVQAKQEKSFSYLLDSVRLLAQVQESMGNYRESLAAHKEAEKLTQDFQGQIVERELALLRADFELDDKERALAKAGQEAIVRNGFIMFVLALAFIGYLFVSRRSQMQRAEERAEHADDLERLVTERTVELEAQVEQANTAESARVVLERQLAEAEKMRILGQLTGGVAHDFNNLLTVIIGASELLSDSLKNEAHQSLLDHILTAAASGADITRALMAYARKQPLQLETVNLNSFLAERMPLVTRTLGRLVQISLSDEATMPLDVVLDSSQLTTALLNLALNARDAQDHQGALLVTLSDRDSKWAVLSVTDTGVGMTPEQIERAVEPFYTTKPEQGNGLGLSMVYGFSKQLGGDLEIDSVLGQGTTISVVLPLAQASATNVHHVAFGNTSGRDSG